VEQEDSVPSDDRTTQPSAVFVLEEYRNISSAFGKLHDVQVRIFNYFLGINAVPLTMATLLTRERSTPLDPHFVPTLMIVVAILDAVIALALLNARLEQYLYARCVNLMRRYFVEQDGLLANYLLLPTTPALPPLSNLGFVLWEIVIILAAAAFWIVYALLSVIPEGSVELVRIEPATRITISYFSIATVLSLLILALSIGAAWWWLVRSKAKLYAARESLTEKYAAVY